MKAKRLIAEHKLKKLKAKHDLECALKELEMKDKQLEQQSESEEAKIEESAWQQALDEGNEE